MVRALVPAAILVGLAMLSGAAADQRATVRLTVTVVLVDDAGATTPVAHLALLVSDNPPSAPPQRIVTDADGTAGLSVRPGTYIVESDRPVAFGGQAYRWFEAVEVGADGDAVLSLTADNARVGPLAGVTPDASSVTGDEPVEADPWELRRRWQDSVVALWTQTARASGFVVDARGLIATSQRAIGDATFVEVQLTTSTKVGGTVLVADPMRDIALVRVSAGPLTSVTPVPLECERRAPQLVYEQELLTIGVALRGARDMEFGEVRHVTSETVEADFDVRRLSPGGPVFDADGRVVGLTSMPDVGDDERALPDVPIVGVEDVCATVRSAANAMVASSPPDDTLLPVEPSTTIPMEKVADVVSQRAGNLLPYGLSSSDFDVTFLTPVQVYAGLFDSDPPRMDFGNWSEYVRGLPPVLLVRVTPKQSESFWMKLVRGAVWTQGASLPPITHFKPGFARLQAFCGEDEVTPVHPFRIALRVSETDAVHEGLVVFSPDALGPHCGTVRLTLYSEKDPDKADTLDVDPGVLRRIREDFALYRGR